MLRTAFMLIAALVALPIVAFLYGTPLSPEQWDTLRALFWGMAGVALLCFVVSEISGNYSQVDKLWSLLPIAYTWFVAFQSDYQPRVVLMAILATLWGARLTFNFARRGGYHWIPWKGEEDYRWSVLRKQPHLQSRLAWSAFNLFFISLYQNTLILLFTLPVVAAWTPHRAQALGLWDALLAFLLIAFIVFETIADQQQYNFQTEKYRRIKAGETLDGEYAQGFRSSGLWGVMRHPNYAAEQSIWVVFYFFSVVATGAWINWSLTGVLLLLLLFQGSADFSEKISAEKYPAYREYLQKIPRFLPLKF